MTSPYRDSTKPGGWTPWRERLLPLLAVPGEWVDFPMATVSTATSTVYKLREGLIPVPRGRWRFRARQRRVQACYLQG